MGVLFLLHSCLFLLFVCFCLVFYFPSVVSVIFREPPPLYSAFCSHFFIMVLSRLFYSLEFPRRVEFVWLFCKFDVRLSVTTCLVSLFLPLHFFFLLLFPFFLSFSFLSYQYLSFLSCLSLYTLFPRSPSHPFYIYSSFFLYLILLAFLFPLYITISFFLPYLLLSSIPPSPKSPSPSFLTGVYFLHKANTPEELKTVLYIMIKIPFSWLLVPYFFQGLIFLLSLQPYPSSVPWLPVFSQVYRLDRFRKSCNGLYKDGVSFPSIFQAVVLLCLRGAAIRLFTLYWEKIREARGALVCMVNVQYFLSKRIKERCSSDLVRGSNFLV